MDAPRRILCGVSTEPDGGESIAICTADRHTAGQAMEFASRVGAELRLVHVVDWIDAAGDGGEGDIVEIVREALAAGREALEREAAERSVALSFELCLGKPSSELLRVAGEWSADMIAISPRREALPRLGRVFHGSTCIRVLKDAGCGVWVVDPDAGEVKRVLALVDRTAASPAVIESANMLARAYGADRQALCCLDYPADMSLHRLPRARREIERYHAGIREEAFRDLEALTAGDPGWKLTLGQDWVVRQVPELVAARDVDLVVLAAHSKPGLAGTLLGSTAQSLLERVETSVWVVRF